MSIAQITKDNFEAEVLRSPIPVLVEFWATWCNPCKMMAPLLDQLEEKYAGQLKIGQVNVDEETDLTDSHQVVSVPVMVVYKNGECVGRGTGSMPKHEIEKLFTDLI
jgi:thioredoxin 1